uniref:Secreted protein n=1 Tax=Rhipicephalus appendiculatus TaxID=34631 RepID=A0A131YDP1_RHIAP
MSVVFLRIRVLRVLLVHTAISRHLCRSKEVWSRRFALYNIYIFFFGERSSSLDHYFYSLRLSRMCTNVNDFTSRELYLVSK